MSFSEDENGSPNVSSNGSAKRSTIRTGDRWDEIACAWVGKDLLRDVYAADGLVEARPALDVFYDWVDEVAVPELSRLARTVRQWQPESLAYHQQRYSNAKTETANLLVEKQRRTAHGYRNFENYRLRLLLNHGVKWDTQPTPRSEAANPRWSRRAGKETGSSPRRDEPGRLDE